MNHHIYHTYGFVIGSKNKGEANKLLTVYTREMGLIRAMVQGVRLGRSELRFSLQDFSYAKIDFVRGKDIWRITTASNISTFPVARSSKDSILFMAKISSLLERLCDGEEANPKIFDDLVQTLFILDDEDVSKDGREALEIHLVLRIMDSLGYIGESSVLKDYLDGEINIENTKSILDEKRSIISFINKALSESQL